MPEAVNPQYVQAWAVHMAAAGAGLVGCACSSSIAGASLKLPAKDKNNPLLYVKATYKQAVHMKVCVSVLLFNAIYSKSESEIRNVDPNHPEGDIEAPQVAKKHKEVNHRVCMKLLFARGQTILHHVGTGERNSG